jgi:NADH-quinone oxidoreductase subunit C
MNPSADALRRQFGPAIRRVAESCGDTIVTIDAARNREILGWLKQTPGQQYNYLVDVTAVEYRDRELPIELV